MEVQNMGNENDIFITPRKAAEMNGIDADTVRKMAKAGEIPGAFFDNTKPVGRWKIPMDWQYEGPEEESMPEFEPEMEQVQPSMVSMARETSAADIVASTLASETSAVPQGASSPRKKKASKQQAPPKVNPIIGSEAEEGLAALLAGGGSQPVRNVKVYQRDPYTEEMTYIDELSHLPPNPLAALQDLAPNGGTFFIAYWDVTKRKEITLGPFRIAPRAGGFQGQGPMPGPGGFQDFGMPVGRGGPMGPDWQGDVMRTVTENAFNKDRAPDPLTFLKVHQDGQNQGASAMTPMFEKFFDDRKLERDRLDKDIERIRALGEQDRLRDREMFTMLAKEREAVSEERLKDRETFYSNMQANSDKLFSLQSQQLEIQRQANENQLSLQKQMLEQDQKHWEQIRTLKDSMRPWEAFFKMFGEIAGKFGDKMDVILGQRGLMPNPAMGGQPQIAPPKDEPADAQEAAPQEETPMTPEEEMAQRIAAMRAAPTEFIIEQVKGIHTYYFKIIDGMAQCLSLNAPPSFFLDRIAARASEDHEIPFIIRAMASLEDPWTFFDEPHVEVPEEQMTTIRTKGKEWVGKLHGLLKSWVAENQKYFVEGEEEAPPQAVEDPTAKTSIPEKVEAEETIPKDNG